MHGSPLKQPHPLIGRTTNRRRIRAIQIVGFFFGIVIFGGVLLDWSLLQKAAIQSPIVGHFLAPWQSLKKLSNLIHVPIWFEKSDTHHIELAIEPAQIEKMVKALPFNPETAKFDNMTEANKGYNKAQIIDVDSSYSDNVKIRYRGVLENSWLHEKKALRVKFPKTDYYHGMRQLNFFLPEDRAYFGELLVPYEAKKLGLLTTPFEPVTISINKRQYGMYLAAEAWSPEFLARSDVYDSDNIFGQRDPSADERLTSFAKDSDKQNWKSYIAKNELGPFPELNTLIDIVSKTDDATFVQTLPAIVNMDNFYRWELLSALHGSVHADDTGNVVLLFKKETGKFEFLPWDVGIFEPPENYGTYFNRQSLLARRILQQPQFMAEFKKVVAAYVSDPKNLEDVLNTYDEMYKKYRDDFYRDQAKIDTDIQFDRIVKTDRRILDENYKHLQTDLAKTQPSEIKTPEIRPQAFIFGDSFASFLLRFVPVDEFIKAHPDFIRRDATTLVLRAGNHDFFQNVIVPEGLRLQIDPGANIRMAPRMSFVSYSPVTANGTAGKPITIGALDEKSTVPWASFAVIDTKSEKNVFSHVTVNGGSSVTANGIFLTSQFNLHGVIADIDHSTFENGTTDDGLHAASSRVHIDNSTFRNNSSDAVDFDYMNDSQIVNSVFYNNGKEGSNGDAIDLSGSHRILIENDQLLNFGDKGVSVGEQCSDIFVKKTLIWHNSIGIASKDNSSVMVEDSKIVGNTSGIDSYRKKPEYIRGGSFAINRTTIGYNGTNISVKDGGSATIANSVVQGGYAGERNTDDVPALNTLIPVEALRLSGTSL